MTETALVGVTTAIEASPQEVFPYRVQPDLRRDAVYRPLS
jgi:hypothetical protein